MDEATTSLIFVFNADATLFGMVSDFAHKVLSPKTYPCRLCALTYDNFGVKRQWEAFVQKLDMDATFLHKDEFEKKYRIEHTGLPAVFAINDSGINMVITREQIENCTTLKELEMLVLTNPLIRQVDNQASL